MWKKKTTTTKQRNDQANNNHHIQWVCQWAIVYSCLSTIIARPQETFAPCKGIWIPKSGKNLACGIRNLRIWNPESKFHWQRIQNPVLLAGIITFTFQIHFTFSWLLEPIRIYLGSFHGYFWQSHLEKNSRTRNFVSPWQQPFAHG